MSGFLYYLPTQAKSIGLEELQAAGMGYAFESPSMGRVRLEGNGPDGGAGVMVRGGPNAGRVGIYPDKQTWRKIPGLEAWVGIDNDDRPVPGDVARDERLKGHLARLNDGQEWLVPVIRQHDELDGERVYRCAVPQVSELQEDGTWTQGRVLDQFAEVWDIATRWQETQERALIEADDESDEVIVTFSDAHDAAAKGLAVNYRLGPAECALLELFTESAVGHVLNAMIDWPSQMEWLKKTIEASGGEPSGDGPSDDSPDTDQR